MSKTEFWKKDCAISTQQKLDIQGNEGVQTLQWGALKEESIQRNICGFPRAKFFGEGDCEVGHQNHHKECIVVCWCVKMTRKFGKSKSTFIYIDEKFTR